MGDIVIITDDEEKPKPQVIVVTPQAPKTEKVIEKTTVTETKVIE